MESTFENQYTVARVPAMRRFAIDAGILGRRRHFVHGLLELDVTEARRAIRAHQAATGERLSFTAFIISCLAKAIEAHKEVHAIQDWRGRLIIFDDVSVNTLIEIDGESGKIVMPHLIQSANRKSFRQIHSEIREAQAHPAKTSEHTFMKAFLWLPGFLRRLLYWIISRAVPQYTRALMSSVVVTAVGMFGGGGGWGIPLPYFPLSVTLGGISKKPGVVDDRIEVREYLDITLSFDHDAIDGAPAARFAKQFRELVEAADGLGEILPTKLENDLMRKNNHTNFAAFIASGTKQGLNNGLL